MANCRICTTPMLHYENPGRDVCPKEGEHWKVINPQNRHIGRSHRTPKGIKKSRKT